MQTHNAFADTSIAKQRNRARQSRLGTRSEAGRGPSYADAGSTGSSAANRWRSASCTAVVASFTRSLIADNRLSKYCAEEK